MAEALKSRKITKEAIMDKQQLPELRKTLLEIMDAIHELCVKEKIRYYIIGGTALGAIRHGGFIPWDTDIDIAMPRSDYNKFFEICDKCIRTGFGSISYHNENKFYLPHALVVKKATLIHWNSSYYKKNKIDIPIYVDVFPLDEAPDNEKNRIAQEKAIRRKIRLQSRRNCIIYQRNNLMQQIIKTSVAMLLSGQSNKAFNSQLDALMARYSDGTHHTWCSMASHYS